jgi:hypothetical protein
MRDINRRPALQPLADEFTGGPAYVDMLPGVMPEPVPEPVAQPAAPPPVVPPVTPSPDAPPIAQVPDTGGLGGVGTSAYVPGFTPMLQNAAPPAAQAAQEPVVPLQTQSFVAAAPVGIGQGESGLPQLQARAQAQAMQAPFGAQSPSDFGLDARQDFIDEREMYMGAMPDRFSGTEAASNALANAPQRDPVTGLLLNAQGEQGFQFMTDRGRQAGYGKGNTGFITADPNAQYRMWDERGKNRIVSEGTGVEALQNIYNTANQFNKEQGKKANWGIERLNPTTGQWERIAENDPAKNVVGKIADVALPTIGAIIAGPLGAAAGSAVSGVAQGRAIEDIALRAAIAGGATYAGGQLFGPAAGGAGGAKAGSAASSLAGSTLGAGTMGAVGAQLAGVGAPIIVTNAAGSALGSALGSAAGSALGSAASGALAPSPSPLQQQPAEITPEGEITVIAPPQVGGALPVASAGASVMAQAGLDAAQKAIERQAAEERENEIIVETQRPSLPAGFDPGSLGTVLPNIPLEPVFTPDLSPEIVVETPRGSLPSGFDPGPLSAALPDLTPTPVNTPDLSPEIVVTETKPSADTFEDAFSGLATTAAPADVAGAPITVTANQTAQTDTQSPLEQAAAAVAAAAPADVVGAPITVTADPNAQTKIDENAALAAVNGVISTGGILPSGQTPTDGETTLEEKKSLGDKLQDRIKGLGVSDYLKIAALLAPLLGGGGGGRPAPGRIPAGFGSGFSPIFGGGLPRATLPGATGNFAVRSPSTVRPQTTQDYYRYGYGPSQSFFDYVPQGAPNTSRAFTGYFEGGGVSGPMGGLGVRENSYAVNGPGTGRSDEIPALLSDGEYVIDAETVALLGDGSSKAGANRLDQFRINVRKDKGRNLAKGEFSVNAKRPEHYLKGGRA